MRTNLQIIAVFFTITLFLLTAEIQAQSTILKLPSNNNTSSFDITRNDDSNLLRLFGDGGFYVSGILNNGSIPISGEGIRLMWYSRKAAFRAGGVSGNQWDDANIGPYSVSMGFNNIASGIASFSMGGGSTVTGNYSAAFGLSCFAAGSTAFSAGQSSSAGGTSAIALGNSANASGGGSIAIGAMVTASGLGSAAIGSLVSTNGFSGAFILGDNSSNDVVHISSAANQMTMRFAGGYRLFTNSSASIGVSIAASGSSWGSVSDSTKKENFINADGESFLNNLSALKLGSWNYKIQDKNIRHYGPMAQEIFRYFGKDGLGIIGNDTTLATADMDGIIMICLQALEKRTNELQKASVKVSEMEKVVSAQDEKIMLQQNIIDSFKNELQAVKAMVSALSDEKKSQDNLVSK